VLGISSGLPYGNTCFEPPAIGDTYQGGIVFYLDSLGGGLIAASTDQSSEVEWGCQGTSISTGTAIGTGTQNTIDILAGCSTSGIAADVCANLTLGGYSDWFLPSKDEFNEMVLNIGLGDALGLGNILNLSLKYYWSSSEWNATKAYFMNPNTGSGSTANKDGTGLSGGGAYVRAIRAF
tara:strand:- start:327 stop:863 length:537 start_codon:yes stop_codon:yes gene_type:complete